MKGNAMRSTMILAVIFAAVLPSSGADAAARIDNPEKFVRDVYTQIAKSSDYREPEDVYTPRLKALLALDSKEAGGEVGRIDFDVWTNSQDSQIKRVRVASQPVENAPSRRIVVAKFGNIGRSEEIHFYFEKAKDGWQIDDMRSAGKE